MIIIPQIESFLGDFLLRLPTSTELDPAYAGSLSLNSENTLKRHINDDEYHQIMPYSRSRYESSTARTLLLSILVRPHSTSSIRSHSEVERHDSAIFRHPSITLRDLQQCPAQHVKWTRAQNSTLSTAVGSKQVKRVVVDRKEKIVGILRHVNS
ncbi:hypothetical protein ONS95_010193 [Cadophora gregata]|uniref:uncharacterized protein n=1 Tax=Cadophora gregata TaxID=51156 RepID=UPI0026DD14C5|nr:uncharacterized protein ONS95_010193 [Cadophora gregata]KAK0121917.1 hypothetical protein ONS95_010193 [Cadophora gregata]